MWAVRMCYSATTSQQPGNQGETSYSPSQHCVAHLHKFHAYVPALFFFFRCWIFSLIFSHPPPSSEVKIYPLRVSLSFPLFDSCLHTFLISSAKFARRCVAACWLAAGSDNKYWRKCYRSFKLFSDRRANWQSTCKGGSFSFDALRYISFKNQWATMSDWFQVNRYC